jgi:5-methylcytosine-specific restriction endonuclease McrA
MSKKKYNKYMHSKAWRRKRKEAFAYHGSECAFCGAKHNLHIHHKSYKSLFNENMDDLMVLCEPCHMKVHKRPKKIKKPKKIKRKKGDIKSRYEKQFEQTMKNRQIKRIKFFSDSM